MSSTETGSKEKPLRVPDKEDSPTSQLSTHVVRSVSLRAVNPSCLRCSTPIYPDGGSTSCKALRWMQPRPLLWEDPTVPQPSMALIQSIEADVQLGGEFWTRARGSTTSRPEGAQMRLVHPSPLIETNSSGRATVTDSILPQPPTSHSTGLQAPPETTVPNANQIATLRAETQQRPPNGKSPTRSRGYLKPTGVPRIPVGSMNLSQDTPKVAYGLSPAEAQAQLAMSLRRPKVQPWLLTKQSHQGNVTGLILEPGKLEPKRTSTRLKNAMKTELIPSPLAIAREPMQTFLRQLQSKSIQWLEKSQLRSEYGSTHVHGDLPQEMLLRKAKSISLLDRISVRSQKANRIKAPIPNLKRNATIHARDVCAAHDCSPKSAREQTASQVTDLGLEMLNPEQLEVETNQARIQVLGFNGHGEKPLDSILLKSQQQSLLLSGKRRKSPMKDAGVKSEHNCDSTAVQTSPYTQCLSVTDEILQTLPLQTVATRPISDVTDIADVVAYRTPRITQRLSTPCPGSLKHTDTINLELQATSMRNPSTSKRQSWYLSTPEAVRTQRDLARQGLVAPRSTSPIRPSFIRRRTALATVSMVESDDIWKARRCNLGITMSPIDLSVEPTMPVTTRKHWNKGGGAEDVLDHHILSAEDALVDSPISLTGYTSDDVSDTESCETPMTTPSCSPLRSKPSLCVFVELEKTPPQLDGSHDDHKCAEEDHLMNSQIATITRDRAKGALQFTLQLLESNEESFCDVSSAPHNKHFPSGGIKLDALDSIVSPAQSQEASDYDLNPEHETLLVAASLAKGTKRLPFPRQHDLKAPSNLQRLPSALLKYRKPCDTPQRRHFQMRGLRFPDRFIPGRIRTPTKESLVLPTSTEELTDSRSGRRHCDVNVDLFGPSPRPGLRSSGFFTTVRNPPRPTRPSGRVGTLVDDHRAHSGRPIAEDLSWSVGGLPVTEGVASTTNGRGGRVTSGTSAPHYTANFLQKKSSNEDEVTHGHRLAYAMGMNGSEKLLDHSSHTHQGSPSSPNCRGSPTSSTGRVWRDGAWQRDWPLTPTKLKTRKARDIPIIPFRVLDAPALRDDYYCSLLAYSSTVQCLAVGLGPHVYLWSEARGSAHTNIPDSLTAPYGAHITSLSFSSGGGGSTILAIGRADGRITLWSPLDHDPRFDSEQPAPVSCVCFRPTTVRRSSIRASNLTVSTEELIVGDEMGNVYFYSIEWPTQDQRDLFDWHGSMTLLARISCHSQQVCGVAWSHDGCFFATGGNDNQLFLFESKHLLAPRQAKKNTSDDLVNVRAGNGSSNTTPVAGQGEVLSIIPGQQKNLFVLNAAVKAIAFAPWQPTLLAAGGGSNDRCIHFFHTASGARLATIDCHAQVTSLIWSVRRKQIAATFGFAQPEHPYRIGVFSWPACQMVVGIPWWSEERALYAVSYPRGPSGLRDQRRRASGSRADAEGRP